LDAFFGGHQISAILLVADVDVGRQLRRRLLLQLGQVVLLARL
jgi:hypothetical protein